MLGLSLLHLQLPDAFLSLIQPMKEANGFLAMLMIGVGFEFSLQKGQLGRIVRVLALRYGGTLDLTEWYGDIAAMLMPEA